MLTEPRQHAWCSGDRPLSSQSASIDAASTTPSLSSSCKSAAASLAPAARRSEVIGALDSAETPVTKAISMQIC